MGVSTAVKSAGVIGLSAKTASVQAGKKGLHGCILRVGECSAHMQPHKRHPQGMPRILEIKAIERVPRETVLNIADKP